MLTDDGTREGPTLDALAWRDERPRLEARLVLDRLMGAPGDAGRLVRAILEEDGAVRLMRARKATAWTVGWSRVRRRLRWSEARLEAARRDASAFVENVRKSGQQEPP